MQEKQMKNVQKQMEECIRIKSEAAKVQILGDSDVGKTEIKIQATRSDFRKAVRPLAEFGLTTSFSEDFITSPGKEFADIIVTQSSFDDILVKMIKNITETALPLCKHTVASYSHKEAENPDYFEGFVKELVLKRYTFNDPTFKVHQMYPLWGQVEETELFSFLFEIYSSILSFAKDRELKTNYNNLVREQSKERAAQVLLDLIEAVLVDKETRIKVFIESMIKKACKVLVEILGFSLVDNKFFISQLQPEYLLKCIKYLTNAEKKSKETDIFSIACLIDSMTVVLPGKGIRVSNKEKPIQWLDIPGLNNESARTDVKLKRLKSALLSTTEYDVILYLAKYGTANTVHSYYLEKIIELTRPSQLLIGCTFMDKHHLFDEVYEDDEELEIHQIVEMNRSQKKQLLDVINELPNIYDAPVLLPRNIDDIVCFGKMKRNGQAAIDVYDKQMENLLGAIGRGYLNFSSCVDFGNRISEFTEILVPKSDFEQVYGELILNISTRINEEYIQLRSDCNKYHHMTLKAVIWHWYWAHSYESRAYVWKNLSVFTLSDVAEILFEMFDGFKFTPEVAVKNPSNVSLVHKEFEDNLRRELYEVAKKIILTNDEVRHDLEEMAKASIVSKWKLLEDLRTTLLNAVADITPNLSDYIKEALINANNKTYKRLSIRQN